MKHPTAVRVQIPAPLRPLAGGSEEIEVVAADVAGLIEALEQQHHGFRGRLCDSSGSLRSYVRVFVNDEDVRHLADERTPLKTGDVVAIVPAIAGGSHPSLDPSRRPIPMFARTRARRVAGDAGPPR